MNVQQRIAVIAVLIGFAGTAGIASYSNAVVAGDPQAVHATASVTLPANVDSVAPSFRAGGEAAPASAASQAIPTLPTIIVHPSKATLRQLQLERSSAASGMRMPYYSFSSDAAGA